MTLSVDSSPSCLEIDFYADDRVLLRTTEEPFVELEVTVDDIALALFYMLADYNQAEIQEVIISFFADNRLVTGTSVMPATHGHLLFSTTKLSPSFENYISSPSPA